MTGLPAHLTPEKWVRQIVSSRDAMRGGVVKRAIRDVERRGGRDFFLAEAERRGFQVVQKHRHFVVFCNAEPIRRVRRQ